MRAGEFGIWLVCGVLLLGAGSAQALSVTAANLGGGVGCADAACTDPRLGLSSSASGTGTLTLGGGSLTFNIVLPLSTFLPGGPDDNGVTQLDFVTVTYSGTATVSTVGTKSTITDGSASISGTQTPTGAGTSGPFFVADSLLAGMCNATGGNITCGFIFQPSNDFNFVINGQTRWFTHTMNLTVPEPSTGVLLGAGLIILALCRQARATR
jgi:hypothetical protein